MKKISKKQHFILMVQDFIDEFLTELGNIESPEYSIEEALEYFESLKKVKESTAQEITENGKNIILFMQKNIDNMNNLFKSKEIAEGLFTSSRAVSGAMRKLVTDGYVDKIGESPITYSLTEKGKDFTQN